jgi:hypothetical protein
MEQPFEFPFFKNRYYKNGCYDIAKVVFNKMYNRGIRTCRTIERAALVEMQRYCKDQGWNQLLTSYNICVYGSLALEYWFTRYENTLIDC